MEEPKIVERDGFTVVGIECFGRSDQIDFPKLWGGVFSRIGEISKPSRLGTAYGVSDSMNENGEFRYLAGIAVEDDSQIPEGMKSRRIPAGKYAVFTHKGSLESLKDSYNYIHNWLPQSGYEAGDFNFEVYDERTKDYLSPESEMEVWIPIKR